MSETITPGVHTLHDRVVKSIKVLLLMRDLSARQLADRIGVKQAYMSRRMTGEVPFNVDELEVIAAALRVAPEALLREPPDEPESPAPPELRLVKRRSGRRPPGVNRASSPATSSTIPAPAPRHPVAVGQTATAVAVRTRTNGPRSSRPLWRHG